MKKITAALIGAGSRGMEAYATYALKHPNEIEFVAVSDIDKDKVEKFKKLHNIADNMCFGHYEELLAQPKLADCILICTPDALHFEPAKIALEKGYHLLLEKPMSPQPKEVFELGEIAKKNNKVFSICHVLRYTKFYETLKKIVDSKKIGDLMSIQHNEYVGFIHQSHSFVRGNWRNSDESSPMILQKSCHDMDILLWLVNADCKRISSFGKLSHFKAECAPEGAPKRCLDGCPHAVSCPYYAPKIYLTENVGWPTNVISVDTSLEARTKALEEGPYGRCVYHCDNNVVDHQVVNMEFDNEVTVAFTMSAFSRGGRTMKLMGTNGEIRAHMGKNEIEIYDLENNNIETIALGKTTSGHGGGDFGIMRSFVELVQNDGRIEGRTSAKSSVQSHLMAFAAEKSRVSNKVVEMDDYIDELAK